MKDMLYALYLFTNINFYKPDDKKRRFALCYLPFTGFIAGLVPALWSALAGIAGLHAFVAAAVGTVLCALVGDRFILGSSRRIFGIVPAMVYYALIWVFLLMEPLWGAVLIMGVFTLSRVLALVFVWEKEYLKEGVFSELFSCSPLMITAIITTVWLMASVAILQMHSIFYFIMAALTAFIVLVVFERRAKKSQSLRDEDVSFYVAYCEFAVICEFVVFNAVRLIFGR